MKKLSLNEDFISRIWENNAYFAGLLTTDNLPVEILYYGKRNLDSGPDYFDAQIKINDVTYTGDVEIHREFKDWELHKHTKDPKYNKVILQVVLWESKNEADNVIPKMRKSRMIPTVVLSKFLTKSIHEIWKEIINDPSPRFKIPCYPKGKDVDHTVKKQWIEALALKRLKLKSIKIKERLQYLNERYRSKKYWEKVLFEFICEALGYSKNKVQFKKLAENINIERLRKTNQKVGLKLNELDAVLYGSAGFLHDERHKDEYIVRIKDYWSSYRSVFKPEVMYKAEWNFFRLRPTNFPTVRIAAASGILHEILNRDFLERIVVGFESSHDPVKMLDEKFNEIKVSQYWNEHYNFGKPKASEKTLIGKERITDIITNVILPMLYLYAVEFNKEELLDKVIASFTTVKRSGKNEVTRAMEAQLGYKVRTISEEQGIIQLHNLYCVEGKCKACRIGEIVFGDDMVMEPLKIILY